MKCNEIGDLLPAYSEGDLPEKERELVEEHLASCMECSQSAEFYEQLGSLAESLFEEKFQEVSEEEWDRVWEGICAEIAPRPVAEPAPPEGSLLGVLRRRWLVPALAGALAILILALLNPFKGRYVPEPKGRQEAIRPEGVEVAREEFPPRVEDKSLDATEELRGMEDFLAKDMEGMAQLAARQLWALELEGIKAWDKRESPLLGLQGALEFLGEKVDYDYLRFASGASFHFFFHRESLGQEQEYSMATLENAAAAYGYSSQWVIGKGLPTTLKLIEEAVSDNRPVLTVGLPGSPKGGYRLIIGYNQEEETLQVRGYGKGQSSEYVWIPIPRREWQAPFYEHESRVKMPLFIVGDKGEIPSRREVARKVLSQAIEFSRGRENLHTGYYSGLAAYEKWIGIFREERKPEQALSWSQGIMRVSYNPLGDIKRRNQLTSSQLRLLAREFPEEEAKEVLLAAANNYTKMTATAKELENLLSSEAVQGEQRGCYHSLAKVVLENEAIEAKAIELLERMLESERATMAQLESLRDLTVLSPSLGSVGGVGMRRATISKAIFSLGGKYSPSVA